MDFDNDDKLDFGPLLPAVDALLQRGVASHFVDPAGAEAAFRAAIDLDPSALPAYRCLFKHYNRKRQFAAAHRTALDWLAEAARQNAIPADWQGWTEAPNPALAALKGLAFIELRRGNPAAAAAALDVLLRLDPADGVGGSVIAALLPEAEALA
jgi:tetratricopeptide (TPR) repeat protein